MSDLLPCPFCGGEAVKVDGYTVACAQGLCIGWTIRRASPHEWNTRTVQAQIDAAVKAERERYVRATVLAGERSAGMSSSYVVDAIAAAIRKVDQP